MVSPVQFAGHRGMEGTRDPRNKEKSQGVALLPARPEALPGCWSVQGLF